MFSRYNRQLRLNVEPCSALPISQSCAKSLQKKPSRHSSAICLDWPLDGMQSLDMFTKSRHRKFHFRSGLDILHFTFELQEQVNTSMYMFVAGS